MSIPWPAPDWAEIEPFPFIEARRPFTGPTRDNAFVSMRYFKRPDGSLAAIAAFGSMSEGAPGQAHGGAVLTVLDEALGAAAWNRGHRVLTARLETEFRKSVPVGAQLLVETSVGASRHRLVLVEGRLVGERGELYAAAKGRFIELDAETRRRIFGR